MLTTDEIKNDFRTKGYCHIPDAFKGDEILEMLAQTEAVLKNPNYADDFLRLNQSQHIHKVKYMFDKGDIYLKNLVHPSILHILKALSDDVKQVVPTWEDMLIKIPNHGIPVTVHQDLALQSASYDVFSIGIYLHDATENPVYYLPGSFKHGPLTKDEIYKIYETNKSQFVPVFAKAGDIVVHNVKTVHFSEENTSSLPRYTWYLEFRTIEQLMNDSPWNQDWIHARRAIWVHAIQAYQPALSKLIPDMAQYTADKRPNLKISHTNEYVDYDMKSPYNHFA